jgi:HD-GYP domain-containing protein (c-di-GMP phosphodiesterase class II)
MLKKIIVKESVPTKKKVDMLKNVTEKYVEELYTEGLKPRLLEEGQEICNSTYALVQRDRSLYKLIREYKDFDPTMYNHIFLVSLFSVTTCKNLEWAGKIAVDKLVTGCFFHDIGILRLPKNIHEMDMQQMSEKELELYHSHPDLGVEMLEKTSSIGRPVLQIVGQHHEMVNGAGFPNGIRSVKMFPLAKIVSLINDSANYMVRKKIGPIEAIAEIMTNKKIMARYDQEIFGAFARSFMKEKKRRN